MPYLVEVESGDEIRSCATPSGITLLEALQQQDIPVNTACHGQGTCGKCLIKLKKGFLPITACDREHFSEAQLAMGYRLSCQARPKVSCSIAVPTQFNLNRLPQLNWHPSPSPCPSPTGRGNELAFSLDFSPLPGGEGRRIIAAVDLGTTNVDIAFLDAQSGQLIAQSNCLNRQIKRGYDVMTRLTYGIRGPAEAGDLQSLLIETLNRSWTTFLEEGKSHGIKDPILERWVIAGNTCMTSCLWNEGLFELSQAPYRTTFSEMRSGTFSALLPIGATPVTTFPILGSFVGGDAAAAALACNLDLQEGPLLLIDIGTNVELLLKYGDHLYVCSTPAGPAFEGGNISIGMRAEGGAITKIQIEGDSIACETIGNLYPKGICGSGLVQALSELVRHGWIKADGEIANGRDEIPLTPKLSLTQGDIREFQLAKGALCTGIILLMEHVGLHPVDLKTILLTGNFGQYLDLEAAMKIKMLPTLFLSLYKKCGNQSLQGATVLALNSELVKRLENIQSITTLVELALNDRFQAVFVKSLAL